MGLIVASGDAGSIPGGGTSKELEARSAGEWWQFEKWLRADPWAGEMVREQVQAEGRANQGGKKKLS